jgi:hypothetical protein
VLLAAYHGRDTARIASGLSSESATPRPRNCTLDMRLAREMLATPLRDVQAVLVEQARRSPDVQAD